MSLATLFAALLGTGSPLTGRGVLFSLALPVSRTDWLVTRVATGLAELAVLTVVPSLVIAIAAPLVGQHYGFGDALVHSIALFLVSSLFFALAVLLSTLFSDLWRPLLLTCAAALVVGTVDYVLPSGGLFAVMSAQLYFETGSLPLIGLLVSVAASAALLYAARWKLTHRDF
jgi:ABC-type transport system involved in multi-copper enzyme maturation permease subunit